ncbi:hypothetical protein [Streptomyces sp. NPDC048200]|uniref:hypothetical protein n=1 Tax=Streptomyces sp. NPDC048200 TaxID=3365512 RepID=UPI00371E0035
MKNPLASTGQTPLVVKGARILAALSVVWSGYAISDLMNSGPWGITVAVAGDIGWITVLWAEANRVRIAGHTWPATAAGWFIASGVGTLLAIHGGSGPDGSGAKAAAGVLVIAVSKIVWLFALAAEQDPAALTDEQETALADARRDQAYDAELNAITLDWIEQDAEARITRIRAEGRVTLAQDEVDFEVRLERHRMAGEIERKTPLALTMYGRDALPPVEKANNFEAVAEHDREQPSAIANTDPSSPSTVAEQIANNAATSPNSDRGQPSIAELVREQIAITPNNSDAVRAVMTAYPDANKDSVAAAVRRERRKTQPKDGYA